MSTLTTRQTLAALVLSAAVAGPALANVETGNLALDVQSAVSGEGIVFVTVNDEGVATLTGQADPASRLAAERTALSHDDVDEVINLIQEGE